METEQESLLTLSPYYIVYSDITKKPYIDRNNSCYLFEVKFDAQNFANELGHASVSESAYIKKTTSCTEFYSYGIEQIRIKTRKNKEFVNIKIKEEDITKQFYNVLANRAICRLKQTNETKYLRELKGLPFFVPVLIDIRMPKQYPVIHYSYASFSGMDKYYLLFSTIQEFDKWNKDQENKWSPLGISLDTMGRIRGNDPVIINPIQDKLILTDRLIKTALTEKKEGKGEELL